MILDDLCVKIIIMVRLINKNNLKYITKVMCFFVDIQDKFTYIAEYNNPGKKPCIYAMWHGNQFCVHGIPHRSELNILISNSIDGDIVTAVSEHFGYQVCRGSSQRRGAVSGTLKMIEKLKNGENIAIMVDGPRGPLHSVKSGAYLLAKEAGVPIVPVVWYSPEPNFVKFPSWDFMTCPFGPCHILNAYADPIYVGEKSEKEVADEIKKALLMLDETVSENYKEAKKLKLWKKKR